MDLRILQTVDVKNDQLRAFGLEMGIFTLISLFVSTKIIQKIRGNLAGIEGFFSQKSWEFLKKNGPQVQLYLKIFKFIVVFVIFWPIIFLFAWGASVYQIEVPGKHQSSQFIFLIGLSIIFLVLGILYLRFGNLRMKAQTLALIFLGFLLFFAYQIVAVIYVEDGKKVNYLGLTAVFLEINAFVMTIFIFLSTSSVSLPIMEVLNKIDKSPNSLETLINDDENTGELTTQSIIVKDRARVDYNPTHGELFSIFTIAKKPEELSDTILGGGFQTVFKKMNSKIQNISLFILYIIALGILAVYSYIAYNNAQYPYLGPTTAVAVVTTDILVFLLIGSKLTNGPLQICFIMISFRCFLFGFGGEKWFLGYCSLYILLQIFLSYQIVDKHFPKQNVPQDENPELNQDLSASNVQTQRQKLLKNVMIIFKPEFIYLLAIAIFVAIILVLNNGVDKKQIPSEGFYVYGVNYSFVTFGVASIFITLIILLYFFSVRIYIRHINKVKSLKKFTIFSFTINEYYIFITLTYLFLVALGIVWQQATGEYIMLFSLIFLPLIYESYLTFYFNWKINEFSILGDVAKFNNKIEEFKKLKNEQNQQREKLKNLLNNKDQAQDQELEKIIQDLQAQQLKGNTVTLQMNKEIENLENQNDDDLDIYVGFEQANQGNVLSKLEPIDDWRAQNIGFISALRQGKLLATDKKILKSLFFLIAFMVAYSLLVGFNSKNLPILGLSLCLIILIVTLIATPLTVFFQNYSKPSFTQAFLFISGLIISIGWGLLYIGVSLGALTEMKGTSYAYYFVFYVFIIPWITFYGSFLQKWKDTQFIKIDPFARLFGIISLIIFILFGIFCLWGMSVPIGLGVLGFMVIFYFINFVYYIFMTNNKSMPRKWLIICQIVLLLVCLTTLVAAAIMDNFSDFVGFSITWLILNFILMAYSVSLLQKDWDNKRSKPLFYSPWIFPIYQLDTRNNKIVSRNTPTSLFLISTLALLIWGLTVTVWINPVDIGIMITALVEVLFMIIMVYIITFSSSELGQIETLLNGKVVKNAWLDSKQIYLEIMNAVQVSDLKNYQYYQNDIQDKVCYLNDLNKLPLADKNYEEIGAAYTDIQEAQARIDEQFQNEINFLISFYVSLLIRADQEMDFTRQQFLDFVQENKKKLLAIGIIFSPTLQTGASLYSKYEFIMTQYNKLSDGLKKRVQAMKVQWLEDKKKQEELNKEREKKDEEARKKRDEELAKKLEEMMNIPQEVKGNADDWKDPYEGKPLSQIPDCPDKMRRIILEFNKSKKKYEDEGFPCNQKNLTPDVLNMDPEWKRPVEGAQLFLEGHSPNDVQQGMLGDCYYLTALTCLNSTKLMDILLVQHPLLQLPGRWECGAYIVRFIVKGNPVYVIIDDKFPFKDNYGGYLYGKCLDPKEVWCQVMEKAYAKLYGGKEGGYFNIGEGGFVSFALSDLTGGIPFIDDLAEEKKNQEVLWKKMKEYARNGYLMGAGSQQHSEGDSHTSDTGIVASHAYALLDCIELEGNKLIQVRNPHGHEGAEWSGDWSDKSPLWTQRMKTLAAGKYSDENDGTFWMNLYDFTTQFAKLYTCKIFNPAKWTEKQIEGEWKGQSAQGVKGTPQVQLLPQYGLKIPRRCDVVVVLEQYALKDRNFGKFNIGFKICKPEGKSRIKGFYVDDIVGSSGSFSAKIKVLAEVNLNSSSFPQTFIVVPSTFNKGEESKFKLTAYCTEKDFEWIDNAQIN